MRVLLTDHLHLQAVVAVAVAAGEHHQWMEEVVVVAAAAAEVHHLQVAAGEAEAEVRILRELRRPSLSSCVVSVPLMILYRPPGRGID